MAVNNRKPETIISSDKRKGKGDFDFTFPSENDLLATVIFLQMLPLDILQFHNLAVQTGGVTFLLASLILLMLICVPMLLAQFILGQYGKCGILRVWMITPVAVGIGYSMLLLIFTQAVINSATMTATLIYSTKAFSDKIPWRKCPPSEGNISVCVDRFQPLPENLICCGIENKEGCVDFEHGIAALFYFRTEILPAFEDTSEWQGFGNINVEFLITNVVSWFCMFLVLTLKPELIMKAIPTVFKIFISSEVILLLVFITKSGVKTGIKHLLKLPWETLIDVSMWCKTFVCLLTSHQLSAGILIIILSYSDKPKSRNMDLIIIPGMKVLFHVLNLFLYFCAYGIVSEKYDLPIECFLLTDLDFWFGILPEVIQAVSLPQLWVFVCFMPMSAVLLTAAAFGILMIVNCLTERFPVLKPHQTNLKSFICILGCLATVPILTDAYLQILYMLRVYLRPVCAVILLFLFCVFVFMVYGIQRLLDDNHFITFESVPQFLHFTMYIFLVPFTILAVFTIKMLVSCDDIGSVLCYANYGLLAFVFSPFVLIATFKYMKHVKEENLTALVRMDPSWGPQDRATRTARRYFNPRKAICYTDPMTVKCKHNCLLNNPSLALLIQKFKEEREMYNAALEENK